MTEEEQDKIYQELRKKYSDEEIAESFVFSSEVTKEEAEELKRRIDKHKRKR